jgi:hypothetical protein
MSLSDIDAAATSRRIQEIADGAKKAFETHAQSSADLDAAARQAAAKEEADRLDVEERRAAAETPRPAEKDGPRPPRTTLALGAEEFALDRQARRAGEDKPPKPSPWPRKKPPADDDMSGRTWLR